MKKLLTLIIAMLFLLTACGEQIQEVPLEENEVIEAAQQEDSLAMLGYAEIASNDMGYYYTRYNITQDGTSYNTIRYVDFETRSDLTLCARPECTHDNETCNAFLGVDSPSFNVFNDKLYLLHMGTPVGKSNSVYELTPPEITMRDLSGENEQTVVTFDMDAILSSAAVSSEHVYALVTYREESTNEQGHSIMVETSVIEKISIATGEKEVVFESKYNQTFMPDTNPDSLNYGKGTSAMSGVMMPYMEEIVGDSILFSQIVITEEITGDETSDEYDRKFNSMTKVYMLYNTLTGETKEIYEINSRENVYVLESAMYETEYSFYEGTIENKFMVHRIDYNTGQRESFDLAPIFSELEQEGDAGSYLGILKDINGELIVYYNRDYTVKLDNGQDQYMTDRDIYIVNLENVSARPITLSYLSLHPGASAEHAYENTIVPITQYGDYFLVQTAQNFSVLTVQAQDGSVYEAYNDERVLSLILKEDYFNNVPNYIPLTKIS